jgi:hypothetical protein
MGQALTNPFPLRLSEEERMSLESVFEAFSAKRRLGGILGRTTRTDVARMALGRGLQALKAELAPLPVAGVDKLPHDDSWMLGGAQVAAELIPPFDWGGMDPNQAGDPILVAPGRGAFVIQ